MSETKPEIPPAMLGAAAAQNDEARRLLATRVEAKDLDAAMDRIAELETDSRRLRWLMECGAIDGFSGVVDDRYDFASQVAAERGHDEPTDADEFDGWRQLIDAAMNAPTRSRAQKYPRNDSDFSPSRVY